MQIAESFNHVVLARDLVDGSLLVRNAGALRSLRAPFSLGEPDLARSEGLAGWAEGPDGRYLILSAAEGRLRFGASTSATPAATRVYLADSNARVMRWDARDTSASVQIKGFVPIEFALGNAQGCTVSAKRKPLAGSPEGKLVRFRIPDAATTLDIGCRGR